jgi:hypothetical protein
MHRITGTVLALSGGHLPARSHPDHDHIELLDHPVHLS